MFRKLFVLSVSLVVGLCLALGSSFVFKAGVNAQTTPRVSTPQGQSVNVADVAFINTAAEAGLANIMLGELALRRSSNQQVRQFAQAEIQEQTQNKNDFTRIAPRVGVQLPTAPGAKYQAIMARMSQLSGTQFDNAYLDEGGVNAHLENAAVFQREAAFGRNPELLAVANRGLPIIKRHFTTASGLTNYQFAQVARRYGEGQTTSSTSSTESTTTAVSTPTSESAPATSDSSESGPIVPQRF